MRAASIGIWRGVRDSAASIAGRKLIGRLGRAFHRAGHAFDRAEVAATGWFVWTLRGLLILLGTTIYLTLVPLHTTWELPKNEMVSGGGHMFVVRIPRPPFLAHITFDSNDDPSASDVMLVEDGRPLGPQHELHVDIMAKGAGRVSFYNGHLYFAPYDNTDPRINGRHYRLTYPLEPAPFIPIGLGIALVFLAVWGVPASVACVCARIHGRIQIALFGASLAWVVKYLAAFAIICIALTFFVSRELSHSILSFIQEALRNATGIVFLGYGALLFRDIGMLRRSLADFAGVLLLSSLAIYFTGNVWLCFAAFAVFLALFILGEWSVFRPIVASGRTWAARLERYWTVRHVVLACAIVAVFDVLPEIVLYWDQSGWMDSHSYDNIAMAIVRGTEPFGDSFYMPVYQFGLAAVYWTFGHFYFVQQIINLTFAAAGAAIFTLTVWMFFPRLITALVGGLFAAQWKPFHHAAWYTQIENWYVPIFAASLLALANYRQRRSTTALVVLALAAALVFNTRLQGAYYAAALGLAPLVVGLANWRSRIRHLVLFGTVFAAIGVLPWSARNYFVEGSFSPSSEQSVAYMAMLNDPRIGLYGVRYWDGLDELLVEWRNKFPDPKERAAAQRQYLLNRLMTEPGYFIAAAPWRLASFYGLLPDTYLERNNPPRAPNWLEYWKPYVDTRYIYLAPMLFSLIGFALGGFNLVGGYLVFLIGSNVFVALMVGSGEPRLCYPVLYLHGLLMLLTLDRFRPPTAVVGTSIPRILSGRIVSYPSIAVASIGTIVIARTLLGQPYSYRPLMVDSWRVNPDVTVGGDLPILSMDGQHYLVDGKIVDSLAIGKRYVARLFVTNSMFPPKYVAIQGIPSDLAKSSTQYYYSYVMDRTDSCRSAKNEAIFAAHFPATVVNEPIKEGARVDAEVVIENFTKPFNVGRYWIRVDKATLYSKPGTCLPRH